MAATNVMDDGGERAIRDVGIARIELASVERELVAIYVGFDPARPQQLLMREEEIVTLNNRRINLKKIVDRWDEVERASANIVCHLNASGSTLRGRTWHVSNVRAILTLTTYYGVHLCGVHDIRNGVERPEKEWRRIAIPVIIPEAQWLEVQAGIVRNSRHVTPPTFVSGPTMLAGIAKCGHPECGNALTTATGKGGAYRYYRCSRRLRRGETACPGVSMRDNALETIVIDALADRLFRPDRLRALLANLLDDSSAAVREREAHLKALHTERTRVERAIQNMFHFIEQGTVSARDTDFAVRLAKQQSPRRPRTGDHPG